jgi:hypothetical protein
MTRLIHLGDLEVALPLAAALGAWLLAAGAWRSALGWLLLFGAAVLLVGGTKIAFLGWGVDLDRLDFKAISGHATVVTALYPMLAFVMLAPQGRVAAHTGLATGLALGALVAGLLVAGGEHTPAEAASGWLLGAGASLGGALLARDLAGAPLLTALWWSLPVFVVAAWLMESAHIGYWMIRLALALSGSERPHSWDSCG